LPAVDAPLETLRDILLREQTQRIAELEGRVAKLEGQTTDPDAIMQQISPVLAPAIGRVVRESQEDMVGALYPLIGRLVMRAVSEAVRDLARSVDARVRTSLDVRTLWWRLRARLTGVSAAEIALRQSLPFEITEALLIHREQGLLLSHVSRHAPASSDSDLISGMLTAIRDFAQDALGPSKDSQLDEIQYGERRILIESGQHAYLAVVVDGTEPPEFRATMREQVAAIEHSYGQILRHYQGDASQLFGVRDSLSAFIQQANDPR